MMLSQEIPDRVGNYAIVEKIGQGGMGAVFKARHVELGSYAAVKFLPPDLGMKTAFVGRFEREGRHAAKLTSPYSVRIFDVGEVDGVRFILMEYVTGEPIDAILKREGKIEPSRAMSIVYNVAEALKEAHDMGIIHRDIKPSNIILNDRGTPKLTDLGLAKDIGSEDEINLTVTGAVLGTPNYMSPEQARGHSDLDARTDIYSLGATFYRMVVGELPFTGDTPVSVMHKIATEPLPDPLERNPDLSPEVGAVICKMMAKEREDRYQSIDEVMSDLRKLLQGREIKLTYEDSVYAFRGTKPRWKKFLSRARPALHAIAATFIGLVIAYFIARYRGYDLLNVFRDKPIGGKRIARLDEPNQENENPETGEPKEGTGKSEEETGSSEEKTEKPKEEKADPVEIPKPKQPSRAEKQFNQALLALRQGRPKGAAQACDKALEGEGSPEVLEKCRLLKQATLCQQEIEENRRQALLFRDDIRDQKLESVFQKAQGNYEESWQVFQGPEAEKASSAKFQDVLGRLKKANTGFAAFARDAYRKVYPRLEDFLAGEQYARGMLQLSEAREKYGGSDHIKELVKSYASEDEYLEIAVLLRASKGEVTGYNSADEAEKIVDKLNQVMALCAQLTGKESPAGSIEKLQQFALERRAIAREASGNYAAALADACCAGNGKFGIEKYPDRPSRRWVAELSKTLDQGQGPTIEMLAHAGAVLESNLCLRAREALTKAMLEAELAPRIMRDREETMTWYRNFGPFEAPAMVPVEAGKFPLGVQYAGLDSLAPSNSPMHIVELQDFYIDSREVTNQKYQRFLDADGYSRKNLWRAYEGNPTRDFRDATGNPGPAGWSNGHFPEGTESHPVRGICWYEARAYARWAGKRLPSEAEWECAAVGKMTEGNGAVYSKKKYPWGEENAEGRAVLRAAGREKPQAVASMPEDKSSIGCYDMIGNVREWTASSYDPYPETRCEDKNFGQGKITVRGASYADSFIGAEPTLRRPLPKSERDDRVGFRCVWSAPWKENQ
ncbi:MAG: bifunctional serine/threonine-protein kinase/formylglycine-generating enzyme family protein [Candidatus Brocadiia bacterium]